MRLLTLSLLFCAVALGQSNPVVQFETTKGNFKIELFPNESPKTVENHVRNTMAKLHLARRHELIRWAVDHGVT